MQESRKEISKGVLKESSKKLGKKVCKTFSEELGKKVCKKGKARKFARKVARK